MIHNDFGATGLRVSQLGLGAGQIGDQALAEDDAARLLNEVVDLGVTLIDTARGYGLSEERIGRHLGHRRRELVLSTKVGYGIPGQEDWTYDCVRAGVEAALVRLRTDCIDIVHLHSCPLGTLERGESLRALEDAVAAGKVRVAAYSGENEALDWAVDSGRFAGVQCSVNLCDQRAIDGAVARARQRGLGVIAKRPLANAPWRFAETPLGNDVEEYWWRWHTMAIDTHGLAWADLALRFAAFTPGVSSCIVGTARQSHLLENLVALAAGPLPDSQVAALRHAFADHDPGWWVGHI